MGSISQISDLTGALFSVFTMKPLNLMLLLIFYTITLNDAAAAAEGKNGAIDGCYCNTYLHDGHGQCGTSASTESWCYIDDDENRADAKPSTIGSPYRWSVDACKNGPGIGTPEDKGFCSPKNLCDIGQGQCKKKKDCKKGLKCGRKNCQSFHPKANKNARCCEENTPKTDGCYCNTYLHDGLGQCASTESWCYIDDDENCADAKPSTIGSPYRWSVGACKNGPGIGTPEDKGFCSPKNLCNVGQGQCKKNKHCKKGLKCGRKNCRSFHPKANANARCCEEKALKPDGCYCNTYH